MLHVMIFILMCFSLNSYAYEKTCSTCPSEMIGFNKTIAGGNGSQRVFSAVLNPKSGQTFVVWVEDRVPSNESLQGQLFSPTVSPIGTVVELQPAEGTSGTVTSFSVDSPLVVFNPNSDEYFIAWFVTTYDSQGVGTGSEIRLLRTDSQGHKIGNIVHSISSPGSLFPLNMVYNSVNDEYVLFLAKDLPSNSVKALRLRTDGSSLKPLSPVLATSDPVPNGSVVYYPSTNSYLVSYPTSSRNVGVRSLDDQLRVTGRLTVPTLCDFASVKLARRDASSAVLFQSCGRGIVTRVIEIEPLKVLSSFTVNVPNFYLQDIRRNPSTGGYTLVSSASTSIEGPAVARLTRDFQVIERHLQTSCTHHGDGKVLILLNTFQNEYLVLWDSRDPITARNIYSQRIKMPHATACN